MTDTIKPRVAICVLSREYNQIWVDFLHSVTEYDVYFVIDDNSKIYSSDSLKVNIIQIIDEECKNNNYYNSSIATNIKKPVISWDKALYFFNCRCENKYEHVWFLEDDVFVKDFQTLYRICRNNKDADLLCSYHEVNLTGNIHSGWNHWVNVIHKIGTPWAHSLICCCRLSGRLLEKINEYVQDRPLLFIEALFNTLALHNGYKIVHPIEMTKTITWNYPWTKEEIMANPYYIYHPVKKQLIL